MIFKPLNTTIEKSAYTIRIANMDVANGHWGTEKSIAKWLEDIETISYQREEFPKLLVKHCLDILKYNIRTEKITFYAAKNQIILLVVSDRRSFGDVEFLSRKMEIELKKQGMTFSIIEILKPENKDLDDGIKVLPSEWKFDEELNTKLSRYSNFV